MTEELTDLAATLEKQRQAVLVNLDGLSDEQISTPSSLSVMPLLGIVQHLGYVERRWSRWEQPRKATRATTRPTPHKSSPWTGCVATTWWLRTESDAIIASFPNGDASARNEAMGLNIRQIVLHLIEETAQHAGQANIIREAIDGSVGT